MRKSPGRRPCCQTYALFGEYAEQASGAGGGGGHGDGQPGPRLPGGLYCPEHRPALHRQAGDPGGILPFARLRKLNGFLVRENNVLGFEHEMESKVRDQLVRTQRDQILRTQIRVLQNELGRPMTATRTRLNPTARRSWPWSRRRRRSKAPAEGSEQAGQAALRLRRGCGDPQLSGRVSGDAVEHHHKGAGQWDAARRVLEKDHFGLEKVKERILETIAVRQMNPDVKGQILCLVGRPAWARPPLPSAWPRR